MSIAADSSPVYDRKINSARQYWLRAISAGCGEALIPIDRPRMVHRPVEYPLTFTLSEVTLEKLSKLTAGSSFLLYVTLLAAVKVCLYKYTRNHVVTVGGPPRGVEAEYPEPAHVLAIVDKIERGMSFRTLLLNVKETVAEAYQFQNYPLRDFVTDLEVGDETQLQPQVLLAVKDFHGDIPPLKSDITLRFERVGAEIRGVVDFDYGLFSPDIIQQF